MNSTIKTKFLLHLNQRKQQSGEQGFTLIELLVVIIIIGILAAIALPSFLNQANKGKQAEAKQYVSSINKGQQAYFTEQGKFVTEQTKFNDLGVGIKTQTTNYKYEIKDGDASKVSVHGSRINAGIKQYAGTVALVGPTGGDKTSQAVVCESKDPATNPTSATTSDTEVKCDGTNMLPI